MRNKINIMIVKANANINNKYDNINAKNMKFDDINNLMK